VTERKPEALPATCGLCQHCQKWPQFQSVAWCRRVVNDDPVVDPRRDPPLTCPLREASKEKEHAE
jgi:hypothetical protein